MAIEITLTLSQAQSQRQNLSDDLKNIAREMREDAVPKGRSSGRWVVVMSGSKTVKDTISNYEEMEREMARGPASETQIGAVQFFDNRSWKSRLNHSKRTKASKNYEWMLVTSNAKYVLKHFSTR